MQYCVLYSLFCKRGGAVLCTVLPVLQVELGLCIVYCITCAAGEVELYCVLYNLCYRRSGAVLCTV
jgi:hypothetical protein